MAALVDASLVLTRVRDELELAGLVRRPGVAGPLPAMHVEPAGGAPAPGDRDSPETDGELVVTLRLSGELGVTAADAYRRTVLLDLTLRSTSTAGLRAGRALEAEVRSRLVESRPPGSGYFLGPDEGPRLFILSCAVYAGLGPVSAIDGIRTERAVYAFEVLTS